MDAEKDKHLHLVFAAVVLLVLIYYGVKLATPYFSGKIHSNVPPGTVLDAVTQEPIPSDEVARVSKEQAQNRLIYVLSGGVVSKTNTSLRLSTTALGQGGVLVTFSPDAVFLKEFPLPGFANDSSALEEKEISFDDVNVGDTVTLVFPRGENLGALTAAGAVEADHLIVNLSRATPAE